jgi:hypothetical protein
LAHQYYSDAVLDGETIKKAKIHTMELMYNDAQPTNIEFISKMYELRKILWDTMQKNGHLLGLKGSRINLDRINEPTEAKVFNYFIQMREMEISMTAIANVVQFLEKMNTKVVLYTYDSILLDFDHREGGEILRHIVSLMTHNGEFPVKVEQGKTYGQMRDVTNLINIPILAQA